MTLTAVTCAIANLRYTNPAGVSEYSDHWAPSSLRRQISLEQPYAPPKSSEIEPDSLDTASAPCVGGQFTRWIGQGAAANRDARPPIEKRPTLPTRSRFVCWAPSASAFLSTQAGPTQTSIILVPSLAAADITLMFAQEGERQMGALVEAGACLGAGKRLYLVTPHAWSFQHHPRVRNFKT
jgi:hypothetical protein